MTLSQSPRSVQVVVQASAKSYRWKVKGTAGRVRRLFGRPDEESARHLARLLRNEGYDAIEVTSPRGRRLRNL